MSNWTDERVSALTKLWNEGLSATQCAKQLGGVSRNAVIGKVHRLRLSNRAEPSAPARAPRTPAPPRVPKPRMTKPARPAPGRAAAKPVAAVDQARPARAFTVEEPGTATIVSLSAHACKWPIGDPSSDGFTLCGRFKEGGPYCTEHARVAYQPRSSSDAKKDLRNLTRFALRY